VEELSLLVIRVNMMCLVLHEVIELLVVLVNSVVPLLQVEELSLLVTHETHRNVMPMESGMALIL
jgi:hypothetical protein